LQFAIFGRKNLAGRRQVIFPGKAAAEFIGMLMMVTMVTMMIRGEKA